MDHRKAFQILLLAALSLFLIVGPVTGDDIPPDSQPPGAHSTVATSDGHIRDDELAEHVRENLPEDDDGIHCKDVKIFVQCCYGGGLLDDFDRVLSPPHTPPGGVPWVGGSAANADEFSWGPNDAWCAANPPTGDYWTDALLPEMGNGPSVSDSVGEAAANDPAAAGGSANTQYGIEEHPQQASGNGGENIGWGVGDTGTNHEVVSFSGDSETRHQHDTDNFEGACNDMWGGNCNTHSSTTEGRTKQDLLDMITAACANLDDNTQLVIYISGHGDTDFDWGEYLNWLLGNDEDDPILVDPLGGPLEIMASLHAGWPDGLELMYSQGETPDPVLSLTSLVAMSADDCEDWTITFNSEPLAFTGPIAAGEEVLLSVPWESIVEGSNTLLITPVGAAKWLELGLELENLELMSGSINNGMTYPVVYGDLNDDLFVGQTDLDIVLDMWGKSGGEITDPRADVNEDDFVGQTDLDYVLDDWGLHVPPPPPEGAPMSSEIVVSQDDEPNGPGEDKGGPPSQRPGAQPGKGQGESHRRSWDDLPNR